MLSSGSIHALLLHATFNLFYLWCMWILVVFNEDQAEEFKGEYLAVKEWFHSGFKADLFLGVFGWFIIDLDGHGKRLMRLNVQNICHFESIQWGMEWSSSVRYFEMKQPKFRLLPSTCKEYISARCTQNSSYFSIRSVRNAISMPVLALSCNQQSRIGGLLLLTTTIIISKAIFILIVITLSSIEY